MFETICYGCGQPIPDDERVQQDTVNEYCADCIKASEDTIESAFTVPKSIRESIDEFHREGC